MSNAPSDAPHSDNTPRLLLATKNNHKVSELRAIICPLIPGLNPEDIIGAGDYDVPEPVEDGLTFAENALIKARAYAAATGLPSLADDSGLCVDVLGGAPGIFSARWCGRHGADQENLELLLAQLADIAEEHRGAHFHCAVALVVGDREIVREGEMHGRLLFAPRGENGFGYDPIFCPEGYGVSSAELAPEHKDIISHRGAAIRTIAPAIAQELGLV